MIEIRRFETGDAAGVLSMILAIQQGEFGVAITAADQPDLGAIPDFYQTGTGDFWVALSGGAVIGTIGLKDIGNHQTALRKMFVAQSFRGKEHRVAARLLDLLLAEAQARGVTDIYLGTTEKFLAAHRFYEKHGFEEIPAAALPAAFPVMAVDKKFYRRNLVN